MAISFSRVQSKGGNNNSSDDLSVVFDSTPTEGNLLVAIAGNKSGIDYDAQTLSGWTLRTGANHDHPSGGTRNCVAMWTKVAGASESATATLSISGTTRKTLLIQEFQAGEAVTWTYEDGIAAAGGADATQASGSTGSVAAGDNLVLGAGGARLAGSPENDPTPVDLTGLDDDQVTEAIGDDFQLFFVGDFTQDAAGGTFSTTHNWTSIFGTNGGSAALIVLSAVAVAAGDFPATSAPTETSFPTSASTHSGDLPATIDAGDLLLAHFSGNLGSSSPTFGATPSGWTKLWENNGTHVLVGTFAKVADGTEDGGTIDIKTAAPTRACIQVYRITNWFGSLAGVEAGTPTSQATATTSDPPSLTPSWGSLDTLWMTVSGGMNDDASVSSYPAGFSNGVNTIIGGGNDAGGNIATSRLELTAATKDPGVITWGQIETAISNTIAIRPTGDAQVVSVADTIYIHSKPTVDFSHDITFNQTVEFEDASLSGGAETEFADDFLLSDDVVIHEMHPRRAVADTLLLDEGTALGEEGGGEASEVTETDSLLFKDSVTAQKIGPQPQLGLTNVPRYYVRAGFITPSWTEVFSTYASDWTKLAGASSWEDLSAGPVPDVDVLRASIDRGLGDSFNRMPIGDATFLFDNMNEDYSPEKNARVRPNAILSIKAAMLDGNSNPQSWFPLYTGYMKSVVTDPALETNRQISFRCEDRGKQIKNRTSNTSLQVAVRANSLFIQTFRSSGFDESNFIVDGRMSDEFSFAWLDDMPLGDAISRQLEAGAHFIYCDPRGRFRVRDRNFDVFAPTDQTSSDEFLAFRYTLDDRNLINRARIGGQPRLISTDQATIAWLRETDLKVSSGDELEFTISYRDPVTEEQPTPCTSIAAPVQGSDWVLNTESDGTGTDMSSAATLTLQSFATTGKITLGYAGTREAFVSKLQVRGTPLRKQPTTIALSVNDDSIDQYDEQKLDLDSDLIPNYFLSQAYADFAVKRFSVPEGKIQFARKDEWPDILTTDLMSFATAVNTYAGVNSSYLIDNVRHDIALARGIEHTVVYGARLSAERNYLVLDNDPLGKLDVRRLAF